jgi:hypothetical protein
VSDYGVSTEIEPKFGLPRPYVPELCRSLNEKTLAKTALTTGFLQGKITNTLLKTRVRFRIPLLSAFFGRLMPIESYKFIPMSALPGLEFQLRMSPYAMFTSGYQSTAANLAQTTMFQRK